MFFHRLCLAALLLMVLAVCASAQIVVAPGSTYSEDFEGGAGGWSTSGSLWHLATPSQSGFSGADSGVNAWVTDAFANYPDYADESLVSPAFDFTSLALDPSISFSLMYAIEAEFDGVRLDMDLGDGNGFQPVGSSADANWYIFSSEGLLYGGEFFHGSTGGSYSVFSHVLPGAAGRSGVVLRMRFMSDLSITDAGAAFDSVTITAPGSSAFASLDQDNPPQSNVNSPVLANLRRAQSFTVGVSGVLDRLDLWFGSGAPGPVNVTVELRPTTVNGLPDDSGLPLISATFQMDPLTGGAAVPKVSIDLTPIQHAVLQGERYAIVLFSDDNAIWNVAHGYGGGVAASSGATGPWTEQGLGQDFAFRTWVDPTLAGTSDGLQLNTTVNGLGPNLLEMDAVGGDVLGMTLSSPTTVFDGIPPLLVGQLYATTGAAPTSALPGVLVDPQSMFIVFDGAAVSSLLGPTILAPGGITIAAQIPLGLSGMTLRLQGFVGSSLANNGLYASTNANDIAIL